MNSIHRQPDITGTIKATKGQAVPQFTAFLFIASRLNYLLVSGEISLINFVRSPVRRSVEQKKKRDRFQTETSKNTRITHKLCFMMEVSKIR